MIKYFIVVISILTICSTDNLCAFNDKDSINKILVVSNETIEIKLKKTPFNKNSHKIVLSKTGFIINRNDSVGVPEKIDNHPIIGTDGELPRFEISQFEVLWNGETVKIPPNIYNDCYEPNFDEESKYIKFIPSSDGSQILIEMTASDGAGSYTVWWIISKNGSHQRFISNHEC